MAGNSNAFVGNTTAEVAAATGLVPDLTFTASSNDAAIYYSHKVLDGEDVYFVSNNLRKAYSAVLSLRGSGIAEVWDPLTGDIIDLTVNQLNDNIVSLS